MNIRSDKFSDNVANKPLELLNQVPVGSHIPDNGLMLLHRPDFSAEVISVQVWVKTGSIHEGELTGSGLSHYLEHMLFKGTRNRDARSISREIHALGGNINAYTTFDRTVYYVDASAAAFEPVVDILSDIVLHSNVADSEVRRERDVILREIDMGLDDPDHQLSQALFRTAFKKHPYREPVIGHRALLERVRTEELQDYYRTRYVPNNLVVIVVGAIKPAACIQAIEQSFGKVPRGRLAPIWVPEEPMQLAPRRRDIIGDFNISRGSIGFKVPSLSHEDSPKLDSLAQALGGGESALLWQRLRNQRKLVNYIDCRNWNPGTSGLLCISYACESGKVEAVEAGIQSVLEEVSEKGLPESIVEKARRQALSAEINGRQTMSGQASRLGLGELVIGDIHYGLRYLKRLETLCASDVQEVARRYLVEEGRSSVSIGPAPIKVERSSPSGKTFAPKPFETIDLKSGARLLLQQDKRLPKVHFRCVLRGGPLYEPEHQRGISALLAELLTKDTRRRNAAEIAEQIEDIGGSFIAVSGNNTIGFAIEVLPADIKTALELLSDALTCPVFHPETFETERRAQIAAIREDNDEILDYGFRRLQKRFFGEHPFSVPADGRVRDLETLKVEDVNALYRKLVRAGNAVLSVSGDFEPKAIRSELTPLLEERLIQESFQEVVEASTQCPDSSYTGFEPMDREQAVVLKAYPDSGLLEEDFIIAEVLNELFSGMSGRLFERIRENQGLAYYVGSTRVLGLKTGMFVFYAGTLHNRTNAVLQEIHLEIERVANGQVSEDELARCRTRLKAARSMGKQTIGARAMNAAIQVTYGLPIDDDAEHAAKLDALHSSDLARFVQTHFTKDKCVQLIVGPRDGSTG